MISKDPGGRGGRRYEPYAFTEQSVAMLSGVLGSPRAVQARVEIMRAFVRMREAIEMHKALAKKIVKPDAKVGTLDGGTPAHALVRPAAAVVRHA